MTITGGVERVASNMAFYFSEQIPDYSVEIISIFKRHNEIPYPIPANVKVRFLCTTDYYQLDSIQKKNEIKLFNLMCTFTTKFLNK